MIRKLKPKSEFTRNVLTLMTGTTIAQAIPIAISPILTRFYTPDDFGAFALYISIVSIISGIATGRYELAIMLPKKDEDAINIMFLSTVIAITVSIVSFLVIAVFDKQIADLLGKKEISLWLYFLPISVFLTSIYLNFNYFNIRKKQYSFTSKVIILQSSTNATGNISFGWGNFHYAGLILTNILTSIISLLYIVTKNREVFKQKIVPRRIRLVAKKYREFPFHTLPQTFIYEGVKQLPIIFIKILFTFKTLGLFALANRVMVTPLSIVGNSLGQVYYEKASAMYREDKNELYIYTKNLFIKLILISTLVGSIIIIYLPILFKLLFGEEWKEAGNIAQFLMIYLIYDFAITPFSQLYLISSNNKFYLKWEIFRFMMLIVLFTLIYILNINDMDIFFLFFSLVHLCMYIIVSIPILKRNSIIWREA